MNPWQLAGASEESQQIALFCFLAKAKAVGFNTAWQTDAYKLPIGIPDDPAIPELAWIYHTPNGGSRGDTARSAAIHGGQLKAAGVKAGVWDIFWPLARRSQPLLERLPKTIICSGLYIEMKKPALKSSKNPNAGLSQEQIDFGNFVHSQGYKLCVCYTWEEAAKEIQNYFEQSA